MGQNLSPAVVRKTVSLATKLPSFRSAQESVAETLELKLTVKHVERLAERHGERRVAERAAEIAAWERLRLMEKLAAPEGVQPPAVVCVSTDGAGCSVATCRRSRPPRGVRRRPAWCWNWNRNFTNPTLVLRCRTSSWTWSAWSG